MKNSKRYLQWLLVCLVVYVVSVFAHECGHGLANAIAGIPCSTGFNRVGDIYKYPSAADFRAAYSTAEPVLLDFGVPCTLVLAIAGTVLYLKSGNRKIQCLGAAVAAGNSLLRLIPCSMVLFVPLFTGNVHVEDEYQTGELLVKLTGNNLCLYIPALISWIITAACPVFILPAAKKRKTDHLIVFVLLALAAMCIGFAINSVLDNYIRINWKAF